MKQHHGMDAYKRGRKEGHWHIQSHKIVNLRSKYSAMNRLVTQHQWKSRKPHPSHDWGRLPLE
jgi:hypothetical protein